LILLDRVVKNFKVEVYRSLARSWNRSKWGETGKREKRSSAGVIPANSPVETVPLCTNHVSETFSEVEKRNAAAAAAADLGNCRNTMPPYILGSDCTGASETGISSWSIIPLVFGGEDAG
ncbi:hypothetical protein BHM03_00044947, partial [Ensete ventricosum]